MSRVRVGFTLVELLVVIAIIGILVAILVPAAQAAREAARRASCNNKLKQIGLAVINHHDTHNALPNGGRGYWCAPDFEPGSGAPQIKQAQRAGWGFQILPFIEQSSVWEGSGQSSVAARQIAAIGAPVPVFFCPTRRAVRALPPTQNWYGPAGTYAHAPADYAGSNLQNTGAIVFNPNDCPLTQPALIDPSITFAALTDGTSNVFLIGEKRMDRRSLGSYQSDDNEGYTAGWDHDVMRHTDPSHQPMKDSNTGNIDPGWGAGWGEQRFGSAHSSGFQVVFGDGAVRFVSYAINPLIFDQLGRRDDGQTAALP